ncbi:MAG TPA: putative peptidoglycan glycosyltransferase FtsW [Candidatus Saccharimonadales bacterium]|nr:putative peptidoglycan glycosyltransferase FtsW [Candidatus Saccharimonadales bacterium]
MRTGPTTDIGRKHRPDHWLVALTVILLAIGVVVVYAISPALAMSSNVSSNYFVERQLIAIALSGVAFFATAQIPLDKWRRAYKPLLVLGGIATAMALVLPVVPQYPAHRWVRLGSFSFQSVELLKFAVLIWLAGFLAAQMREGSISDIKKSLKPLLSAVLAIGIIVAGVQSDLGSAGVMVVMMGTMAFVAGMPFKRIMIFSGIIVIGLILAVSVVPYRRERLLTFLHPEQNCQTANGWQACQSIISVGSGGMFGLGLGRSVQAYGYQPEAANDSIFAIFAEKFGFVGCIILFGLFAALFSRLKRIAERAPDDFSRLLVIGVLTWLSVQAFINIGGMLGLLPLKGITLPFVSYGGTSVVFTAAAIGLVFQISRYTSHSLPRISEVTTRRAGYDNHRDDRRRLRGAYHPDLSRRGGA